MPDNVSVMPHFIVHVVHVIGRLMLAMATPAIHCNSCGNDISKSSKDRRRHDLHSTGDPVARICLDGDFYIKQPQ